MNQSAAYRRPCSTTTLPTNVSIRVMSRVIWLQVSFSSAPAAAVRSCTRRVCHS